MTVAKDDVMIAIGLASNDGSTAPKIVQVAGFREGHPLDVLVRLRMGGFSGGSRFARKARAVARECLVRTATDREQQTGRVLDPL